VQVTQNDTGDVDNKTVTIVGPPAHGTITKVTNTGNVTYERLGDGYLGPDSYAYQVCSLSGPCDTATVHLDLQ
jgi:hypothetical protein